MGTLREDGTLRDERFVFADRDEAGERLAAALGAYREADAIVLAIPSGGVPVGAKIAQGLGLPLDLLIARKLQIPFNTEAGFGAMTLGGEVLLNDELVKSLSLGKSVIGTAISITKEVLEQRNLLFRKGKPMPVCRGRIVIITDDGLASGYTMLAAVQWIKGMRPKKIIAAVPTGSMRTVERVRQDVDELVCLNIRSSLRFAVAEAYRSWHDLSDDEVLAIVSGL